MNQRHIHDPWHTQDNGHLAQSSGEAKGEAYMKTKNGIAIAIYSFILFCIIILLISAGNVTALNSFLH